MLRISALSLESITSLIFQALPLFAMPRRSARLAAKRKRDIRFADDDAKEESPDAVMTIKKPPKKKRKIDVDPMDSDGFPTSWNTSDDEPDDTESVQSSNDSESDFEKEENTKTRRRGARKSGKTGHSKSGQTRGTKRKRKKKVDSDDEVYEPKEEEIEDSEPRNTVKRRRRRSIKKKSIDCKEKEDTDPKEDSVTMKVESMNIDAVDDDDDDKKIKEEPHKMDVEEQGDGRESDRNSSDDSDDDGGDQGLDGIFGETEAVNIKEDVAPKQMTTKKKKKNKRGKIKEEENTDESVEAKRKVKRKSKTTPSPKRKRKKKSKGEYTREQMEMVFQKLDEEGNGSLSMLNILHGFQTINQSDKIEAGLAKRMLLYADAQHDNDSIVRLDDFLEMTRLADLWPVA